MQNLLHLINTYPSLKYQSIYLPLLRELSLQFLPIQQGTRSKETQMVKVGGSDKHGCSFGLRARGSIGWVYENIWTALMEHMKEKSSHTQFESTNKSSHMTGLR